MSNYFVGNTADDVYCTVFQELKNRGKTSFGRNGQTRELLHVCLNITDSTQRWVQRRSPQISPAFAVAELVTIMCGSDNADLINAWNPALSKYQGKYKNYPGAYGFRLRHIFGFDQLTRAYESLLYNGETRQVVLDIWKPDIDLPRDMGKPNNQDIPCNICSMLKIRDSKLYWTQIMRSNDIAYGLPYNLLQFTSIQEIMAGWLGIVPGEYMHICDSLHQYANNNSIIDMKRNTYPNTDRFDQTKNESDRLFFSLLDDMKVLVYSTSKERDVIDLAENRGYPQSFMNLLLLLCSYTAFKNRMDPEVIERCISMLSNKAYSSMMQEWMKERMINDKTTT